MPPNRSLLCHCIPSVKPFTRIATAFSERQFSKFSLFLGRVYVPHSLYISSYTFPERFWNFCSNLWSNRTCIECYNSVHIWGDLRKMTWQIACWRPLACVLVFYVVNKCKKKLITHTCSTIMYLHSFIFCGSMSRYLKCLTSSCFHMPYAVI